ncbi:MAG: sialidase family protein [Limisphaerales bacterium]
MLALTACGAALLMRAAAAASPGMLEVQVFQSGTERYHTFRIPAIVRATNGTLLAFAEGRKNQSGDTGDIDLVLKRSFDQGRTWGPVQIIGGDGTNTFGNPTPIVDASTSKIVLLSTHNAGNVTERELLTGAVNDRRAFVQESTDHGATWSAAREITSTAKRANWRYYATGPGHGFQLARGPHAGRLIAPCNHSTTNDAGRVAWAVHLLYSDDSGATWRIGADDRPGRSLLDPNECSAVELTDGRIYTLARNEAADSAGHRAFGFSRDAGETFDAPFSIDANLVSPVVQGSVLRYTGVDRGGPANRILFSAPGHPSQRAKMTVRSSFDETRTWTAGKVVYDGPSAYSDMVNLPDGKVGLLYESGVNHPYERITFATFSTVFLDSPNAAPSAPNSRPTDLR